MKSRKLKMRVNAIVSDAVENGIRYGWQRAHKYTSSPTEDLIQEAIHDAIMGALSEVINWDGQS